jgi:hypothetical protein
MNILIHAFSPRFLSNPRSMLRFTTVIALCSTMLSVPSAFAVTRCGTFEMVEIPGQVLQIVPFADGTASAIGGSTNNPSLQVLRHFDGISWSEQSLPSEVDGFAFSASGGTSDGYAWFMGTRAHTVYEIEVVIMPVVNGMIGPVEITTSSVSSNGSVDASGAPIDISASSPYDVWALTAFGDIIHFDGSSWSAMSVPNVNSFRNYAKAIYAASPDDVWIVGYGGDGRATYIGYAQHWNGSSWSVVSTPLDGQDPSEFRDIDGSGSDDIWIAGSGIGGEDIMLHWDGNEWSRFDANISYPAAMARVMAMAPGNAWGVPLQSNTLRYWDGVIWNEAPGFSFPDSAVTISMRDVEKASNCDAWVVGDYHDGTAYHPWAARLVAGDVTPPPPPGDGATVFANDIDVSRIEVARKTYYGKSIVTVLDYNGQPVSGALVTGDFSGPTSENKSAITGADGKAVFSSTTVYRPRGNWCFSVSGIAAPDALYDASQNIVTSACEDGDAGKGGKGRKRK